MNNNGKLIGLNLEVDEQLIAESAKNVIQAAVVSALGNKDDLVRSVVNFVLMKKVGEDGRVSSYERDNKHTLLEAFVLSAVRETAKEVVQEIVEENRAEFKQLLKKQLTEAKTLNAFTRSFIDGSMEAVANKYRASININIDNSRD